MIKVRPTGYGVAANISERNFGCRHSPSNFSLLLVKAESRLHRLGSVDVMSEL